MKTEFKTGDSLLVSLEGKEHLVEVLQVHDNDEIEVSAFGQTELSSIRISNQEVVKKLGSFSREKELDRKIYIKAILENGEEKAIAFWEAYMKKGRIDVLRLALKRLYQDVNGEKIKDFEVFKGEEELKTWIHFNPVDDKKN